MKRKVAIYARVSTEHEAQLSALDNQVQYYDNILEQHPDWKLYDRYIDEGITGTSTKKRKNFMRMMEDAKEGHFDLIITREVSRFARNTVDTLQETRNLKRIGVEVWFTEDNIWTLNDEDGELRLTIMATLAQNESKKTSLRVKAGQMVSFQNAVPYGNGNILGYDRVGKEMVINEEQAKTVRMIFDMYESGMGIRKIQFALEQRGRLTATGKVKWDSGVISRVLRNPFYCGTIVYRKQFVPDYLEQKKINNFGNVENVVVEGNHTPIVSKEQFNKVSKMLEEKTVARDQRGRRTGVKPPGDVWVKKMKCECGHTFNRRVWHRNKEGVPQYAYQCYSSIRTGTVSTRKKKGLSTEGICEVPMIPRWKLEVMAKIVFDMFWKDKKSVIEIANKLLEDNIHAEVKEENIEDVISLKTEINGVLKKLDALLDLRLNEEISSDVYKEKREQLEQRRIDLEKKLKQISSCDTMSEEGFETRLKVVKAALEKEYSFDSYNIPESVIDAFVDEIVVYKDKFVWKLSICREGITCVAGGTAKKPQVSIANSPNMRGSSTGCYSQ